MKKSTLLIISLLVAVLLLGGCASPSAEELIQEAEEAVEEQPAEEVVEEPVEEPAEEPAEEPVEEPVEEPAELDLAVFDEAYAAFLSGMAGYQQVKPEAIAAELAENPDLFLLDVRNAAELEEAGHIEGAVNIPLTELAQHTDLLPAFDTPIIVYCKAGTRGNIGMITLVGMGYTNVRNISGGFDAWAAAGNPVVEGAAPEAEVLEAVEIDPAVLAAADTALNAYPEGWAQIDSAGLAAEMAEAEDLILIDVRKPAELMEAGVIAGANHVQLETFVSDRSLWPENLDANIVVYCKAGTRGNLATAILRMYGYTNVRNLKGGIDGWVGEGNPVAGGLNNNYAAFLGAMAGYQQVKPEDLAAELAETPDIFFIDVRNVAELEEGGHIEGAVNIPLTELAQHTDLLPAFDTTIIVYCKAGTRGNIGMMALAAMGYTNVRNISGGFDAWVAAGNAVVEGAAPEAEVLGVAEIDPAILAAVDTSLTSYPEGWAQVAVEDVVAKLVEDPAAYIFIDVRKPEELEETGIIEGALHIQFEEFLALKSQWPADKEAAIVVYCKSGTRGNLAMAILRIYGYTNVVNMKGGLTAWMEGGNPTVPFAN